LSESFVIASDLAKEIGTGGDDLTEALGAGGVDLT
jgi:hypothetical protein